MSAILFLQDLATQINIPLWGLGLTGFGMIVSVLFGANNIVRANRKDTENKIDCVKSELKTKIEKVEVKKVDITLFEKTISGIEEKTRMNDNHINQRFDSVEKKIDGVSKSIDKLIDLHLNEKK